MENNEDLEKEELEEEQTEPRSEEELREEAIEAIEIQEKVTFARQKVSFVFVSATLFTTACGIVFRNPYVTLAGGVPSLFSSWSFIDSVSELEKLDESKKMIKDSRYSEFIEYARIGRQVPVLNSIADTLEEELVGIPDPLPPSDEPDDTYFDDDDTFYF